MSKLFTSLSTMNITGEFFVSLVKGLTIEFYPERFNPARLVSYIKNHAVTTLCGTPTLFNLICKSIEQGNELPIKNIVISGERLSQGVAKVIADKFPDADKYSVYGLTEASPRVSYLEAVYVFFKIRFDREAN